MVFFRLVYKQGLQCIPLSVLTSVSSPLIPTKSSRIYDSAYERFCNWAEQQKIYTYSEDAVLSYFVHLSKTMRSSSLWARYSMIKAQLKFKHNIQMERYKKILMFLRYQGHGYKPKQSKIFSREQFDSFLQNAPDHTYLSTKVIVLIIKHVTSYCCYLGYINVWHTGSMPLRRTTSNYY